MPTTGQVVMGTRERAEVLSQEEIELLGVLWGSDHEVDAEEAARLTGMPQGLAALGLELLEFRGLTR